MRGCGDESARRRRICDAGNGGGSGELGGEWSSICARFLLSKTLQKDILKRL